MVDPGNGVATAIPSQDLNGPQTADADIIMKKYEEERNKRLRDDGNAQYLNPLDDEKWKHILDDPAVEVGTPVNRPIPHGGHGKFLIMGAGIGGILFAAKLIQAGFKADDLLIVDVAGGFGGTWWWNRYPGLMCDVESYIYLPLLEEMGYMPRRKYSSGQEIQLYLDELAKKYGLHQRAMFQSKIKTVSWDDASNKWITEIIEQPKGDQETKITIKTDYVFFASGVLNNAKLPHLPGMDTFKGDMFHTSRWDYKITGGSQEKPTLTGLEGKRVGYIGTGATAVQAVPELVKYAKELYIFQRTPSSIDKRDNKDTDPVEWKSEIATKKGWQRERSENFNQFLGNAPQKPKKDMVNDGWTHHPAFSALIGGPKEVTMENVGEFLEELHALDHVRSNRIRKRVEDVVKDHETAEKLQAWYSGWCKRPCFHDEYLQAFNNPNIHLIDTDGKGIDKITPQGIEHAGVEYPVDILIWGTGFVSPSLGTAPGKAGIQCTGRNGVSIEDRNNRGQLMTLHGCAAPDFPNMFWPGPMQTSATANFQYMLDVMSTHIAHIVAEAERQAGGAAIIEPTSEAVEKWGNVIASSAISFAGIPGCTPSYNNNEGAINKIPQEALAAAAKNGIWGDGIKTFTNHLEAWREQGDLEGFNVTKVTA